MILSAIGRARGAGGFFVVLWSTGFIGTKYVLRGGPSL